MKTFILLDLMTGRTCGRCEAKSVLAAKRAFGWHDWEKYSVLVA